MANTVFKLRRSSVAGKVPNTSTLSIGELGLNITDRKLYSSDGTNVWETGANLTTLTVSTNTSVNNVIISGGIFANNSYGSSSQVLTSNGTATYWAAASAGVNTDAQYVWANTQTFNANVTVNSGIIANGNIGSSGQTLTSNGTSVYWSTIVTNVPVFQSFTGDGSTTTFTVTGGYTPNVLNVFVNGIKYSTSSVTTSSGTSIVFGIAPPNGAIIEVVGYLNSLTAAVNTAAQFTWTNTQTFNSNLVIGSSVFANGSTGSNGQALTTNGSAVYWSTIVGTNTDAQYVWTNTHTFNANLNANTVNAVSYNTANSTVNNSGVYVGGTLIGNSTGPYGKAENNLNVNSAAWLGGIIASGYQTTAGLASNVSTLTANNTTFVGSVEAGNVVSNAQLSANLSNYQTTAGLSANVATLTANNTSYVGSVSAANVVSNAQLSSNLANYVTTTNLTNNLANYQTTAGLSANVATLTANNTSFVGSVSAANVVSNAQLSSNLANYALLSGATFTGNVTANNANTTYDLSVGRNLYVSGNLTIGSNVNIIGANNLSVIDNMIYLNSNSNWANPDVGIAANYNDGSYHHTGIFRDHADGKWKVFDNYAPEPDANIYIETTNTTFHLADFQANTFYAGNTSVNWTVVNTSGIYSTGTVNATSFTVGTSTIANSLGVYTTTSNATTFSAGATGTGTGGLIANSTLVFVGNNTVNAYLNTTGLNVNAATIANTLGVYTTGTVNAASHTVGTSFSVNTTVINIGSLGVYANSGLGTSGQVLTSNGTATYWAAAAAGVNTSAQYTWTNTHTFSNTVTHNGNLVIGTSAGLSANGSYGNTGQFLASNGSSVYWSGGSNSLILDVREQYIGDGACTVFSVGGGYTPNRLSVYVNGILLRNGIDANVSSGSSFTILPAPESGAYIDAVGTAISTAISSNVPVRQTFIGDGSTTTFTVTGGYAPGYIDVYGNGVKYTGSEVTTSSGSTIIFGTAPPNGAVLDVVSVVPVLGLNAPVRQSFTGDGSTTTFTVSGGYVANNLDVYVNGVKYSSTDVTTSSGSVILFGSAPPNGAIIEVVGFTNGITASYSTQVRQSFTGDGSTTTFTVSGGYTPNYIDVYLNGIRLASSEVTTSSGTNIVMSTAPLNGSIIDVVGYNVASMIAVDTTKSYTWTATQTFTSNIVANAIYSTSTINAASYTIGSTFVANTTTLNSNGFIANSTGVYTGVVNATSYNTGGGYGTATGGVIANSSTIAIGNTTANVVITANTISIYGSNVGYMEMPQNSQTTAYTTVLSDTGKHIIHPSSDNNARTFTIANNSSVPYPLGTVLTFVNAANVLTIAINNDTMYASGFAANTGSRTVNAYGIATAIKVGSTSWIISGSNMS